ncbi:MAG: cytochrome P450 [Paracoccaceae bacterium]
MHPDFNALTSQRFRADPFPILAALRQEGSVHRFEGGLKPSWHVLDHATAREVLLDPDRFSSDRSLATSDKAAGDLNLSFLFNNLISATGEKHRRLRMIGNRVFMPKFVERFRAPIETMVDARLDAIVGAGPIDLVEDFAAPITVGMITAILGLPLRDMPKIRAWSQVLGENSGAITWMRRVDPEMAERGRQTGQAMTAYFSDYIEERVRAPRDGDLISAFLNLEVEGTRLNRDEVLSMAMLLLLAGNETTTFLITNAVRMMVAHPDQTEKMRRDPASVPAFVEEVLRQHGSIRNIDRFATKDLVLGGVDIPAGGQVVVWLASANRDKGEFPDPESFDMTRSPNRHFAFGQGMHFCLGAPLARLEADLALRRLLARTRGIQLQGQAILGPNASFGSVVRQMALFT